MKLVHFVVHASQLANDNLAVAVNLAVALDNYHLSLITTLFSYLSARPDANLMITDNNGNTALHIAIQVAQKTNSTQLRCGEDGHSWRTPEKDDQREYLKIVELILSSSGADSNEQIAADEQPGKSAGSNESLRGNGYQLPGERTSNQQTSQSTGQQMNRTNREFNQKESTKGLDQQTSTGVTAREASGELLGPLSVGSPPPASQPPFSEQRTASYLQPGEHAELQSNLVNKQNFFGKTSLHYATLLKPDQFSIRLITILLKSKANADIADFRNCTPLFYLLAEHQTEHRSRNESVRRCSRACPLRSPFIDLLTDDSLIGYKCDRLNLDELDYGITTLKQLCRQAIQQQSPALQRLQSIHYKALPDSLRNYLSRKVLLPVLV